MFFIKDKAKLSWFTELELVIYIQRDFKHHFGKEPLVKNNKRHLYKIYVRTGFVIKQKKSRNM